MFSSSWSNLRFQHLKMNQSTDFPAESSGLPVVSCGEAESRLCSNETGICARLYFLTVCKLFMMIARVEGGLVSRVLLSGSPLNLKFFLLVWSWPRGTTLNVFSCIPSWKTYFPFFSLFVESRTQEGRSNRFFRLLKYLQNHESLTLLFYINLQYKKKSV